MSGIVITRTPFRVSFFGGGSDYPEWYRREGGEVLSTAIDKYSYLYCRYAPAFFKSTHRVVWRHIEQVNAIGEILHPVGELDPLRAGFEDLGELGLVERHFAGAERGQPLGVGLDSDHLLPHLGETGGGDQTHPTAADHADRCCTALRAHRSSFPRLLADGSRPLVLTHPPSDLDHRPR